MSVERSMQRAYAIGERNLRIVELIDHHCTNAEVVQEGGGQGMAEATSGLPINSRTIRCPFARTRVGSEE
jgi:hypothetical protein